MERVLGMANNPLKAVCFLQNAWASALYQGSTWPRDLWLEALWRSRTGKRLKVFKDHLEKISKRGEVWELWFDNTTEIVGDCPSSVVPPNPKHIREVLLQQRPNYIIAFGKQAEKALINFTTTPLLILPHPTWRVLTNKFLQDAAEILSRGFQGIRKPVLLKPGKSATTVLG
jgi:hypothetical protein